MAKYWCGVWATTFVLYSATLVAAGFNCDKAKTDIEKTICSDSRLSEADAKLSAAYSRLVGSLSKPEAAQLKESQKAWLKERNQCLEQQVKVDCLLRQYQKRLALLAPQPVSGTDSRLLLTAEGLGTLNRNSAFSKEVIAGALPAYEVKETVASQGNNELKVLHVYRQGTLAFEVYPDLTTGRIASIVVVDSTVPSPVNAKIGAIFRNIAGKGAQLFNCEAGMEQMTGLVICAFEDVTSVSYAFKPPPWNGPDGELPPRAVLQQAELVKLVWSAAHP